LANNVFNVIFEILQTRWKRLIYVERVELQPISAY